MVGTIGNILPPGLQEQITAIKQSDRVSQSLTKQLASGLDINAAIDDPLNFFTSRSLKFQSSDISRLLDGIAQSIQVVETANNGVEAMLQLVDQAEALIQDALIELFPATDETPDERALEYIRQKNSDKGYFPTLGNFYTNTTDFAPWDVARANAEAAELNAVPEITGHLATITSQEENDVVFGLLTATSWLGGSDDEVEGVWRWVTGPEAGQQFWQGLAGGTPVNGSYENWAPGEPNQFFGPANPENFAHLRADGLWNDLPRDRNLNYIIEWGGDLFVQNPGVNVSSAAMDYRDEYLEVLDQMDQLAQDTQYRGIRLLEGDTFDTIFNAEQSSRLTIEGIDATSQGLGFISDNFISRTELTATLEEVRGAREKLRSFGSTLSVSLSTMQVRETFARETIIALNGGSDDLTVADQNELGAELLAVQTRQVIQFQTLGLSSQILNQSARALFG